MDRSRQITRIVGGVLRLDPAARKAFVDKACAGDEDLRRDVEALLAGAGRTSTLPPSVAPTMQLADGAASAPAPVSGELLGRYRIIARVGAGGMGEVYRARDEHLDRDVAIKLLPAASLDDPAARARLVREARAAAALNHPNVCTIYEVGEADGQAYMAMELVEGRSTTPVID